MAGLRDVLLRRQTESSLALRVQTLSEELRGEQETSLLYQERLAELELALEDQGWDLLGRGGDREFTRDAVRLIARMSRLHYLKNPLIRRAVDVQSFYVWGQGVEMKAGSEGVDEVVRRTFMDRRNRQTLFGHQARTLRESELQVEGNLFVAAFTDGLTGAVQMRCLPAAQIDDVVSDPDDQDDVWYYRRRWSDGRGGTKTVLYPALWHRPRPMPATVDGVPVRWDAPVLHVRVGGLLDMRFGVPEVYPALDWARAHKEYLEDWATLVRSLSRFAWQLTTKGRKAKDARVRLNSTLSTDGQETNPPPNVGSAFVAGENVSLEAIPKTGAQTSARDNKELRLQVGAAVGLPDTILSGDPDQGNLATAKTLDRPTELKFVARQEMWRSIYEELSVYAVARAIMAPRNQLSGKVSFDDVVEVELIGGDDPTVTVEFPPILERDAKELILALVSAATLDGKTPAGTIPLEALARKMMQTLDFEGVDELLEQLERPADPGLSEVAEAIRSLRETAA